MVFKLIRNLIIYTVRFISALVIYYDPTFAIIFALLGIPFSACCQSRFLKRMSKIISSAQMSAKLYGFLIKRLSNIQTIKAHLIKFYIEKLGSQKNILGMRL